MSDACTKVGNNPLTFILQSENPEPSGMLDEAEDIAEKIQTLKECNPNVQFQYVPFRYVRTADGGMSLETILAVATKVEF